MDRILLNFSISLKNLHLKHSRIDNPILLNKIYWSLLRFVKISVVVRRKLLSVLTTVSKLISCNLWCYPCFLLFHMTDKFNWVTSPNLHAWNDSSWRNNTVCCNNGTFLNNRSFKDNWILTNEGFFFQNAWIKSASVLNNNIILDFKYSWKSTWSWSSSM